MSTGAGSFALGVIAAIVVILWNPLTPQVRVSPAIQTAVENGGVVERFIIRAPQDIIAVTHNGANMLNPSPDGIAVFSEDALQPGLVLVAKVRNAAGNIIGFATESETIEDGSNLLIGKLRMQTDWTVVIPGRGTIFLHQIESSGDVGKQILPAVMLGGEWNGDVTFVSTVGPSLIGTGVVIGGTSEFAGASGTFVEITHLTHMSQARGGVGEFELAVSLGPPATRLKPVPTIAD